MDIIQILIILFIIFPFIKRIFDEMKQQGQPPGQKQPGQHERPDTDPWNAPDDYTWGEERQDKSKQQGSWEDALSELEELFTGQPAKKKPEPPAPEPQPIPPVSRRPKIQKEQPAQQTQTAAIGSVDASSDLMDTENPIYKSLDEAPEVVTHEANIKDYSESLHDTQTLRTAFVIREILDTPSSIRRLRR